MKFYFEEKAMILASKQVKLDYDNYHNMMSHQKSKPTEYLFPTFQVTADQLKNVKEICMTLLKSYADRCSRNFQTSQESQITQTNRNMLTK